MGSLKNSVKVSCNTGSVGVSVPVSSRRVSFARATASAQEDGIEVRCALDQVSQDADFERPEGIIVLGEGAGKLIHQHGVDCLDGAFVGLAHGVEREG